MGDDREPDISTLSRSRPALRSGLRLQIVLSLAGLLVLAFVPLFFAVASLTEAALGSAAGATVARAAPLVRLVALYMVVFGLALLVFVYFSLTRLIVRPIDELVDAADRVAGGARTLRVPRTGARELLDLSASVRSMAERLIAEEAALLLKIEELTETTSRLTRTQAQLVRSERMASVGRLSAGLAHEVGNPIAALIGMEDLLLDGGLSPEEQRDFLQRMRRETERIHTVIRDLLGFARPEGPRAGGEAEAEQPAEVGRVVDDVVALARPQKDFRGVRIETEIDGALVVAMSANRLTQVLLNLVFNAGAALASAPREDGHVLLRAFAAAGDRVRIAIDDNGPGVAPAVRDRMFEPFATTKEVGQGTGLGLAVCRGLVESAGGRDRVRRRGRAGRQVLRRAPAREHVPGAVLE